MAFSKYLWDPATVPMAIDFVEAAHFSGSGFPAEAFGHAFASLAGSTYAAGLQQRTKAIVEFPDLDTLDLNGKLAMPPHTLVRYNGARRSTVAAAPEGLLFSDLYVEAVLDEIVRRADGLSAADPAAGLPGAPSPAQDAIRALT